MKPSQHGLTHLHQVTVLRRQQEPRRFVVGGRAAMARLRYLVPVPDAVRPRRALPEEDGRKSHGQGGQSSASGFGFRSVCLVLSFISFISPVAFRQTSTHSHKTTTACQFFIASLRLVSRRDAVSDLSWDRRRIVHRTDECDPFSRSSATTCTPSLEPVLSSTASVFRDLRAVRSGCFTRGCLLSVTHWQRFVLFFLSLRRVLSTTELA